MVTGDTPYISVATATKVKRARHRLHATTWLLLEPLYEVTVTRSTRSGTKSELGPFTIYIEPQGRVPVNSSGRGAQTRRLNITITAKVFDIRRQESFQTADGSIRGIVTEVETTPYGISAVGYLTTGLEFFEVDG